MVVIAVITDKKFSNIIQKKYDKAVEITRADSLNLKVINYWSNRGTYFFNDSLMIDVGKIEKPEGLYTYELFGKLELPFYLKKAANNDTIWVIDKNDTYFVVFREDRE